jgi:hypothetical protein
MVSKWAERKRRKREKVRNEALSSLSPGLV